MLLAPAATFAQQQVTQAEYYVDTDPGAGLATPMVAFDGNFNDAFETVLKSNAAGWTLGMHVIGIRIKDNNGNWGPAFRTIISVQNPFVLPTISIATGECFWDTDPGQGNGTPLLAFDGNFNDAYETVVRNGFANPGLGMHVLNMRVKDVNNNWGPVFRTVVSVQNAFVLPSIRVAAGEFFWDTDPGQGNGTAMLAFDGNFTDAIERVTQNTPAPALGMHLLNVRIRDVNNNWGPVFRTVVDVQNLFVMPSIRVSTAECFWDTDPGQGNGTAMVAFDGNFNDALETLLKTSFGTPGLGMHVLHVRMRDINNNWGPLFRTIVDVQNPFVAPVIRIALAELFWDVDPGQGNGAQMLAFDGNYTDAYEVAAATQQAFLLGQGIHVLNVRAKNPAGVWGPVFQTVVYLDSCATTPAVTVTAGGPTTICAGDSILLTATSGYANYYWSRNGIGFGGNSNTQWVSTSGNYSCTVLDTGGCPGTSAVVTINVQTLNVFVSPPGPLNICAGDSVLLDAGAGYTTYQWSNGSTSQTTWVSGTDTVNVIVTSSIGCTDTSSNVISTSVPVPTVPIISQNADTLFSSSATGNQWYLNGNPIPGATGQYYVANQSGNYTVVVTDGNGCSASSSPYAYIHMDIGTSVGGSLFTVVYPNPVGDQSTLLIHAEGFSGTAVITIMDVTGRVVSNSETEIVNGEVTMAINRETYAAGLYVYTVTFNNQSSLTSRFTVQ